MSGIFGIIHLDNEPVSAEQLGRMHHAMQHWGPHGSDVWLSDAAGLGQLRFFSLPESHLERFPRLEQGVAFCPAGRLDNRDELLALFGLTHEADSVPDGDLMLRAYLRWGEHCVDHLRGDWAFAAWQSAERKLFLARDQYGQTSLFYYADQHRLAFASDIKALLVLNLAPVELDELYLAQIIISWPDYHGERVLRKPFKRLPPAHCLLCQPGKTHTWQYWDMQDVTIQPYKSLDDYVERFRELIIRAVQVRLRNLPGLPIATMLSGGLDSSTVSAVAASLLRGSGTPLLALTSVPMYSTKPYTISRFGDEWPFAHSVANFAGINEHLKVFGDSLTPIGAIREGLQVHNEPGHAAGNLYWITDLERKASETGARILLSGQLGNAGLSWTGMPSSQSIAYQVSHKGLTDLLKKYVRKLIPAEYKIKRNIARTNPTWYRNTAILPDFAHRLNLMELRHRDPMEMLPETGLEHRWQILKPGRLLAGSLHAQMGAHHHLDIRDPSGDLELIKFSLSVPDHVFIDPVTGMDRMLVRAATKGILPDEVRLNQRRGIQAADMVPRLRATAKEVEQSLNELESGPASAYVDLTYLRQIWRQVQTEDLPAMYQRANSILARGIMAGLFVNSLY